MRGGQAKPKAQRRLVIDVGASSLTLWWAGVRGAAVVGGSFRFCLWRAPWETRLWAERRVGRAASSPPPSLVCALGSGSLRWLELAWLLSTQAVTAGLLGRTAPPYEERIFPAPQSGARAPLTLRTDREGLNICLNVWMSGIFATAIQSRSYFHIPAAGFPAPHQSVVYIPEPFYFHSQHSASRRHPERAPPRVRKSPT